MTVRELIAELMGTKCRCGEPKNAKQTFCRRCYYALPSQLRKSLYKHVGDGYEEAYAASVKRLFSR